MRQLILAAATLAITTPALADRPAEQRLTHDGVTYVYTVRQTNERQVIDGHAYPAGKRFHLTVRGDKVTGTVGAVPVSFRTNSAAGAFGAIQVAAR